jgi:hypothetical protein
MRRLTFKGFLRQYLRELSSSATNDIRSLADEVPKNYRLVEPLVLYAMAVNKLEYLRRVAKDSHLMDAIAQLPDSMGWGSVMDALIEEDKSIPIGFHKAYKSYISVRDYQKSADHTKTLILAKTRKLQHSKRVTSYRIYTDLGLNHGNVNTYLRNGDVSKVSLEVAEKVLAYLESR